MVAKYKKILQRDIVTIKKKIYFCISIIAIHSLLLGIGCLTSRLEPKLISGHTLGH